MERLEKLERQVKGMEHELSQLVDIYQSRIDEAEKISPMDKIWSCKKCGFRLGIYDPVSDELRIRYRDFFCWMKAGKDGYIKIVCRGCSELNEVRYTPETTSS
jgi:ribosomal protein L37AE/L43A|tara:strand:+ start:22906 stop:23214 length:309 start_codon:yes stop_codon:yes gene_type:complete